MENQNRNEDQKSKTETRTKTDIETHIYTSDIMMYIIDHIEDTLYEHRSCLVKKLDDNMAKKLSWLLHVASGSFSAMFFTDGKHNYGFLIECNAGYFRMRTFVDQEVIEDHRYAQDVIPKWDLPIARLMDRALASKAYAYRVSAIAIVDRA